MKRVRPLTLLMCNRGAAAVEMALVTPLVMIIMFGSFELGNYFLQEHVVTKAVRDGARYAARRSFAEFAGCAPSSAVERETRNVTRTGTVADGGTPRIANWTSPSSITVTAACDTSGTYTGIYTDVSIGAPIVTVSATITYDTLFGTLGLGGGTLTLTARSQAAVMGV
jgi:TadE-like protein